jgi:hypothetical protein
MPSESPSRRSIGLFHLAEQGWFVLPSEGPEIHRSVQPREIKDINAPPIGGLLRVLFAVDYRPILCESSLNHPLFCATSLLFLVGVGSMVFRVAVAAIIELEQQMREVVALRRALRRFNTERHRRIEFKRRRRAPQRLGNRVTPGRIVR